MHLLNRLKFKVSVIFNPFILHETYYLFQRGVKSLSPFEITPKIQSFNFYMIDCLEDIICLQKQSYIFGSERDLKVIQNQIRKGGLLFCVFVKKQWAHQSWVMLNRDNFFDPFFRRSGYSDAGCIGPSKSNSDFRGFGLYPYVLNQICLYLNEIGFAKALISTSIDNHASVRGIEKAHFQRFSYGIRIKIGPINFWRQTRQI